MGYAMVMSACISCDRPFTYNPMKVPSLRARRLPDGGAVEDPSAPRQPICEPCVVLANQARPLNGLPPITYDSDAYGPVDDSALG